MPNICELCGDTEFELETRHWSCTVCRTHLPAMVLRTPRLERLAALMVGGGLTFGKLRCRSDETFLLFYEAEGNAYRVKLTSGGTFFHGSVTRPDGEREQFVDAAAWCGEFGDGG